MIPNGYDGYVIVMSTMVFLLLLYGIYHFGFGRGKRVLRTKEYSYQHLKIREMSDDEFAAWESFNQKDIPRSYAIAKRREIADYYLDYPSPQLHPDMKWGSIPRLRSPWAEDDYFEDYLRILGQEPKEFLESRMICDIIIDLYRVESLHLWSSVNDDKPGYWFMQKRKLNSLARKGKLDYNKFSNMTIAEAIIDIHRLTSV